MYIGICNRKYSRYLCVRSQNLLGLVRIYFVSWVFFWSRLHLFSYNTFHCFAGCHWHQPAIQQYSYCLHSEILAILQSSEEVTITIRTADVDTVHSPDTAHTQHLQNWM
jgi:hypothetical protein